MSRIKSVILYALAAIAIAVSLFALGGCSKSETEDIPDAVTVAVEGDAVTVIPNGRSTEMYFTVSPASTDFTYSSGN